MLLEVSQRRFEERRGNKLAGAEQGALDKRDQRFQVGDVILIRERYYRAPKSQLHILRNRVLLGRADLGIE